MYLKNVIYLLDFDDFRYFPTSPYNNIYKNKKFEFQAIKSKQFKIYDKKNFKKNLKENLFVLNLEWV